MEEEEGQLVGGRWRDGQVETESRGGKRERVTERKEKDKNGNRKEKEHRIVIVVRG